MPKWAIISRVRVDYEFGKRNIGYQKGQPDFSEIK